MTLDLEAILAHVPAFAPGADLHIAELSGGFTNRNFRVDVDGEAYVLRIGGQDTSLLGIDRRVEYGCTLAAFRVGVAPEPVAFLEPEGYLVTRFLPGKSVPAETIGTEANIRRVVTSLKVVHSIEHFPGGFSPFRVVEAYTRIAREYQAPLPANMDRLLALSAEIERAMRLDPFVPAACHNDLLNANFVDDGHRIRILDWEYAGMGDRFFDLGNFAVQHDFNDDQDECLLRAYFGPPTPAQRARLKLMKAMSDLREAMWAMVQVKLSQLDFDYVGYRRKYFDRFEQSVSNRTYAQWLRDVGEHA